MMCMLGLDGQTLIDIADASAKGNQCELNQLP
jgi:hypothetical protein